MSMRSTTVTGKNKGATIFLSRNMLIISCGLALQDVGCSLIRLYSFRMETSRRIAGYHLKGLGKHDFEQSRLQEIKNFF
jgi:hypothetical protein